MTSNRFSQRGYRGSFPPICHRPPLPIPPTGILPGFYLHAWASFTAQPHAGNPYFFAEGPLTLSWWPAWNRWIGNYPNPSNPAQTLHMIYRKWPATDDYSFTLEAVHNGHAIRIWDAPWKIPAYSDPFRFGPADAQHTTPPIWSAAGDVFL